MPRPKNLNLFTIAQPIPAIASILHRISGIILFIALPFLLWILQVSLRSEQDFNTIHRVVTQSFILKFILWGSLLALIYHFLAGIRHLLMDMHFGETLAGARFGAKLILGLTFVCALMLGIWLW